MTDTLTRELDELHVEALAIGEQLEQVSAALERLRARLETRDT